MVVSSLRFRGDELLYQRQGLDAYVETGATFAMPLLYPWGNRLTDERFGAGRRDPAGLPIHGLPWARGAWTVDDETPEVVPAHLDVTEDMWPWPHRVAVCHELGSRVLRTTTTVDSDGPVAFGWHPYFACAADEKIHIPAATRLRLDERSIPTGETEEFPGYEGPLAGAAFDDLLVTPAAPFRAGRLAVRFEQGAPYAVVFSGEGFICVEPMASPTNALITEEHLGRAPSTMVFSVALEG